MSIFQSKNDTEIEDRFQYKMILKWEGGWTRRWNDSPGLGSGRGKVFRGRNAGQREARGSRKCPIQKRPFPYVRDVFGTARSGQGRAVSARRSAPLSARTVREGGVEGKGRFDLRGCKALRHPAQASRFPEPQQPYGGQRNVGGRGDSSLHCRISRALAAPIFRAHSVSLICLARRSTTAKVSSGFKYCAASGKDFSFSQGVW